MSYRREITTLGRGGSDTTAVALAAALCAERCEIYSDVDGVYSADPRRVPDARHLPLVDVDTMQAMSDAGAKVLGARAVEWARRERIVIHARKTQDFARGDGTRETRVVPAELGPIELRAVVGARSIARLSVHRSALEPVLRAAAAAEVELFELCAMDERATALLSLSNVPDSGAVAASLSAAAGARFCEFSSGLGVVSLVGAGVGADPRMIAEAGALVGGTPRLSAVPHRISVVLPEAELERVENQWHAAFAATPAEPAVSRRAALRALA